MCPIMPSVDDPEHAEVQSGEVLLIVLEHTLGRLLAVKLGGRYLLVDRRVEEGKFYHAARSCCCGEN